MTEKSDAKKPEPSKQENAEPKRAPKVADGTPVTVKTELFRALLTLGMVVNPVQVLQIQKNGNVSLKSRDGGNICMCMITAKMPFDGYEGDIGVNIQQLANTLPKTEDITITPGARLAIEAPDFVANLITISPTDPTLKVSKLKNDFHGTGGFIVGTKDFLDKITALRSTFAKGEYFLRIISDAESPDEIVVFSDDASVGNVKYRVPIGGDHEPETWNRSYDYDFLQPILKACTQFCQEVKVSWLEIAQGKETFAVMVISGSTQDGLLEFSYALAPRIDA